MAKREQRSGRERRRARPSEQSRLRAIVDRMADGIVIAALDGTILFANPGAEELFGRPLEELRGTPIGFPVVSGERAEIEVVRPNAETVAAELRVADIDWNGEAARLLSLRDITDRRRAAERAAQLERERIARVEAEAASQAKSEFLATMSHELRTPLNAVIGYSELLDLGIAGPLNAEQRQHVVRVRASARHLLGLVNEILDLAKVEAGSLSLQNGVAQASDIVDAAVGLVQPAAEARGLTISGRCGGRADALLQGDEDRVRQIVVNLLNNAVKFTPAGGKIVIECGTTTTPDNEARIAPGRTWVFIRVRDTGIGISRDQIGAIFDPFVQAQSGHTRSNDGSGLGLTISRRLSRMMKGDLTVRSTLGEGSTFTLWLPAATRSTDAEHRALPGGDSDSHLRGLASIGEIMLRELEPLLDNIVTRLRSDPAMPNAQSLRFSQLADHLGTYVANIAGVLIAIEEAQGQPSTLISDGTAIQRLVAERHGSQRARLDWTPEALRREWHILGEEIARALRRRAVGTSETTIAEATSIINRLLEQSEEASCRALVRARAESEQRVPVGG